MLQPLAFMAIFTITLGRLAKIPGGGVPYAAFSLSTLVPWTFLSSAVSSGANQLIDDATIMRKVYFPREVPVMAVIVSRRSTSPSGWPVLRRRPVPRCPRLPVVAPRAGLFALLAIVAASVALPFAALNVYYRDFRFVLPFGIQLWLFASPGRLPALGGARAMEGALRRSEPGGGDPRQLLERARRAAIAPDMTLLGISLLGTPWSARSATSCSSGLSPTSRT